MKAAVLLVGFAALLQGYLAFPCIGVHISGEIQESQILKDSVPSPYQLAIDRDTNTLFFSYTSNNEGTFDSVFLNLKDQSSAIIPGIAGGFAAAVDPQNQIVYLGGNDGIYKFDYKSKRAEKLDITDKSIWQMYYKDGLYFTTYPEEKAYVYKDGVTKLVPQLKKRKALLVAFDGDDLVFVQDGELKKIVGETVVVLGDYSVNAFNTDASGRLFFSTPDGIYKFTQDGIKKVTTIVGIYGFAVSGDGSLIYAAESSIVKLNPTHIKCDYDDDKNDTKFD